MIGRAIVLAGRRIDATGSDDPRFPHNKILSVRSKLGAFLRRDPQSVLVCSAAAGADLLALSEAKRLGIKTKIVLPFPPAEFRRTSVMDRPGDWGAMFDEIISDSMANNDLIVLDLEEKSSPYTQTNTKIISTALSFHAISKWVVVVWEGASRGEGDMTAELASSAIGQGFQKFEINI